MADLVNDMMEKWHASTSTDASLASASTAVESLSPQSSEKVHKARNSDAQSGSLDAWHQLHSPSSTGSAIPEFDHVEEVLPRSDHQYPSSWRLVIIIASLGHSTCLVALDTSIIGVAVPKISTVFQALDDIAWYGSAYLLTTTAFLPVFGKFYKFYSVKRTYLVSISIFEGKVEDGFSASSTIQQLTCHQWDRSSIAGVGAAGIFQGCLDIIGLAIPLERRPLYVGLIMGLYSFAFCLGPVLGGVLTDRVSWTWCFWINVPVGVAVLLTTSLALKLKTSNPVNHQSTLRDTLRHIDALGTMSFIGAMVCLLLAFQKAGQTMPWSSPMVISLFIAFGILIIGFGSLQIRREENATIPLRILQKRSVLTGSLFLFFLAMTTSVLSYYIPLFFQAVQSVSATQSGVQYIALVIPQSVASVVIGALVTKWGYYVPYIVSGEILCIVGSALLTRMNIDTSIIAWASYLVLVGLGIGTGMQLPYAALQVVLSETDIAIGNAITVFAWQLGGGIGLAAAQTLFLNSLIHEVPTRTNTISPEAVIKAGAFSLQSLAPNPQVLRELQDAYSEAINKPIIMALVAACLALPFAMSMERFNVKAVAEERIEQEELEQAHERGSKHGDLEDREGHNAS